jgi:2-aminoethylphosphonate dioxygenase
MVELTKEQINFWKANSYIFVPGLFASQVDDISRWVDEVASWEDERQQKWLTFREKDKSTQLSRRENFVPYHEGLAGVLNGEPILGIVTQLMGEKALLYKDRLNFKYPGGGPHWAHQDGVAYEQGENARFDPEISPYSSVLICVDRMDDSNGCLQVVSWPYDKLDILPMEPLLDRPDIRKIKQEIEDELDWTPVIANPGDALFFTERVPHRSGPNMSTKSRRNLYGVYNPASLGDKRAQYFSEKKADPNNPRYLVANPHAPVKSE